jgi:hypothetical protein
MTAALERHPRWVVRAANWLVQLAEKHDLYFWKTYGELFLVWAQQFRHTAVSQTTLFSSLRAMGLDWQYSPLLSEIDVGLAQQSRQPGARKLVRARADASLRHAITSQEQRLALTQALDKARQQQAYGWALRIAYSLATAQAQSGENDAAMQLLQEALQDVDASDRATDVKNALALCARIER